MDLLNMLTSLMTSSSSVDALSSKAGTDSGQTKNIISTALPMLLGAITDNASTESGASSLMGALQQHTNTASMADQLTNADAEDGSKIIAHILGSKKADVIDQISKKTGADSKQVSSLLSNIAPGMMSGISAATTAAAKEQVKKAKLVKAQTAVKAQATKVSAAATTQAAKATATAAAQAMKAAEAAKEEAEKAADAEKAAESAFDLSSLLGILGGGEAKTENSGSGLLGGLLGGILGGGSDDKSDSDGGILGTLSSLFK